ncbi:MAG: nuclease A inhibitor family protein [Bacteroidota bacterium]
MARISKKQVHTALDRAASNILSARGDDPVISRRDIRAKLRELNGYERRLTDMLFRFTDKRDYKPGARVTQKDVEDTLAYAKEKLIYAYDENNNGLSRTEVAQMSVTGKLAVRFAQELEKAGADAGAELKDQIADLATGLYFPAYGNESDAFLQAFYRETSLRKLNRNTFREALGLDLVNPANALAYFQQGPNEYARIFEEYEDMEQFAALNTFRKVEALMQSQLQDITLAILGQEGTREFGEHPVYFVGRSEAGNLIGLETTVIWT